MHLMKWTRLVSLACGLVLVGSVSAKALMIAPQPLQMRLATADGAVVGKVTSIEEKSVAAPRFPNDTMPAEYKIAVIKIEKAFGNIKKGTEVRVGFIPPPPANPNPNPMLIRPGLRRFPQVQLAKDQEVCLLLQQHFDAPFYIVNNYPDAIFKTKETAANFDKDVAEIERLSRFLADPMGGLESKKAEDRLTTVALLISRYKAGRVMPEGSKMEPIAAAESKAILMTLAEADWTEAKVVGPRPIGLGFWPTDPQNLFFRLGLTPQDGWTPPEDLKKLPEAAKKWLRDNADSYRIQHMVAAKKKETDK
jgi:hypothetical protein